ncbi:dihydrofolate reductase [Halopseudomonas salegens]|uniref:Dihydrofolate reductase n=1 Tax=Halopseudomonas salegens TaxID=1434072 RepID=A0A1H2H086_9GAMM|nr:dihydrofolate reductase [Halopseudomonas salegens]SDU25270.1 dihydrofolate reductase [Halopseudomonas salegens]
MSEAQPRLAMIAALGRNRVIGRDNQLPWHLPEDLKYFRARTWGKPIVMGRKTFESLGRPLPGRTNIVLSHQAGLSLPGAVVVASIEDALDRARAQAALDDVDEVMIIGGENLYTQLLAQADRLYLTQVELEPQGDAWFPEWDSRQWQLQEAENKPAGDDYPAHSYQIWDRRGD